MRCDVLVFKQQTDVEAAIEALHQRFGQMVEKDAERKQPQRNHLQERQRHSVDDVSTCGRRRQLSIGHASLHVQDWC